jgi:hypothetical protein
MKRTLKLLGAAFVAAAWTGVVLAGNYTNNFDLGDPTTNTTASGFLIKANAARTGSTNAIWFPYDGHTLLTYQGNATDTNSIHGFVELVDGLGGENIEMVFPDIDVLTNIDNTTSPPTTNTFSLPVQGLTLDMDLRVGNGTSARPADGFSISYARAGDNVLVNATNGVVNGFAGGDDLATAQGPTGSGDVENGTKTGVAVIFDAWQGNWLPDTPVIAPGGSNDREGIEIRVDDVTLFQSDLTANRNIGCQSNPPPTLATLSEQTGLSDLDATGYTNLCWQHLHVGLTNAQITVIFKGLTVLNNFSLSGYSATQGRLVLASRTGGAAQHVGIDNLKLITAPINNPFIQSVLGLANGCVVTLFDVGAAVTTNLLFVGFDTNTPALATNVTAYSSITNEGGTFPGGPHHYIVVNLPYRLAPNSKHIVSAVWQDSVNGTTNDTGSVSFTVPNFLAFPTNFALPLADVDTTKPGFIARSYQSQHRISPGTVNWTEEMLEGLHGPNFADQGGSPSQEFLFLPGYFPDGSGAYSVPAPVNFNTGGVSPSDPGLFNSGLNTDFDFNLTGIGAVSTTLLYQNSALELSGYVYFPTSGVYRVILGADNSHDGYRISVGASPFERIGFSAALSVNAGNAKLPGQTGPTPADTKFFIVDAPGVYPMRIVWAHNADPGGLEIYQVFPPGTAGGTNVVNTYVLMNDTNTVSEGLPPSLLAYQALVPAVQSAPYIATANPVFNSADVLFYQPVVVDLQDGFPAGLTVNTASVTMVTDGTNNQTLSVNSASGLTQVVQQHSATWTNWPFGSHSVTLSFNDNLGTNYSYTWSFAVNPNANPTNVVQIAGAFRVDPSTLDLGQPGFRIHSYQQNSRDQNNSQGFVEEAFEGLRGPNIADQSQTGGNGYYTALGILDYNLPAQTAPAGEYNYDAPLWSGTRGSVGGVGFGFGVNNSPNEPAGNLSDEIELDIQGWLVFPSAGLYTFNFNSDDGDTIMMPLANSLTNKAALQVAVSDVGRGSAGPAQPVNGTYAVMNIPQAGAYPVRILWENGGGGANLEFSVYTVAADGSIIKVPVNDTTDPNSILAYQVSSAPVGPSITYMNPVRNAQDVLYYQPNVVKITDGASTVVSGSVSLKTDGVADSASVSQSAGVTTILQNMGSSVWYQGLHTNILLYADNLGNNYSNWWRFTVVTRPDFISGQEGTPVAIPASSVIPAALVDITQPGFRILSYETTAGNNNTAQWTEEQLQGLHGPNIAVPPTNGLPYYTWNTYVDFGIVTVAGGDYWYDYGATNGSAPSGGLGFVYNGGGQNVNNCTLEIGTYLVFPSAGLWTFTVDSDDGFKVTVPDGGSTNSSPFQQVGTVVGWNNTGRGNSGGHTPFGPTGSRTFYTINMPSAGAIPVRLIYENGGGGANLEWEIFQWLPDGSIQETLVGDTNGVVKAYQTLVTPSTPYVAAVNPIPGLQEGLATPAVTLQSGVIGEQDLTIVLQDGARAVDTNTISVTFNGVAQPIVITTNGAGLTTIFRSGTNFWPSGAIGSLVVTYKDTLGDSYTKPIATANTSFYGTLTGGYPSGSGDPAKPGFLARTWQIDQTGGDGTPGELQANEQILAGIWTNNVAVATGAVNVGPNGLGYYVLQGTGPTAGVVNFSTSQPGANNNSGDFQPNNGYPEASYLNVGIPGTNTLGNKGQNFVTEYLAYIDFPTNGTYYLGVNSDDGFIVTRGWGAPNDNGALIVNSPPSLAGKKPAVPSPYPAATQVTNFITGNVVLAMGVADGSTTNGEACVITNGAALAGNIALVYVSGSCNAQQQIANCVAAGAIAVLQSKNSPPASGFFPGLVGGSSSQPAQPIPAMQISRDTANAILAALATGPVNVTLTPYDFLVNPPAAQSPLGLADFGKGPSDIDFPVVVPQAGVFPIRLLHFANPGGNEVEFYSVGTNNTQRTLINDNTATNGLPGLHAYWGLASGVKPSIALTISGSSITVTNTGTLQMSSDLVNWTDVYGDGPVTTVQASGTQKFFRAR